MHVVIFFTAIARGTIPGPRILTSVQSINENSGGPDQLRQIVRRLKAEHADRNTK